MMSFAGVSLADPTNARAGGGPAAPEWEEREASKIARWVNENIRPEELFPFAYRQWPGRIFGGPILDAMPPIDLPVTIGTVRWPRTASQFARAHFVVGETMLAQIRKAVQAQKGVVGGLTTGVLALADGNNTLEMNMWMLPAWPLQMAVAGAGAYLLTLVDDRYWWQQMPVTLSVTAGVTAWTDLYTAIGTALGIAIEVDTIPSAYGTPTTDYTVYQQPLPAVLDAVAWGCGQRIVRDAVTGQVKAQNALTAIASVTSQLAGAVGVYAGGRLALLPG